MAEAQTRKEEILVSASKLFARLGFKKTTLDEVANEVGIVKSALYRYFENKEQLFDAVIDSMARRHFEAAEQAVQGAGDTEAQLRALLGAMHEVGWQEMHELLMPPEIWQELRPLVEERAETHKRSAIDILTGVLERGKRAGELGCPDPRAVAEMMQAFSDTIYDAMLRREIDEEAGRRRLNLIVDVVMNGIRKRNSKG